MYGVDVELQILTKLPVLVQRALSFFTNKVAGNDLLPYNSVFISIILLNVNFKEFFAIANTFLIESQSYITTPPALHKIHI